MQINTTEPIKQKINEIPTANRIQVFVEMKGEKRDEYQLFCFSLHSFYIDIYYKRGKEEKEKNKKTDSPL